MYRFEKAYLKKNKYFGGKMKILDLSFVKAYMWEYWVLIQYYIFKNSMQRIAIFIDQSFDNIKM